MTQIPVTIRIKEEGADKAGRSIDDLKGDGDSGVEGLGAAFENLTGGGAAGPIGLATAAIAGGFVLAMNAAKEAITAGIEATIEFGNELERQAGIMNRTEGSVDDASESIGGLVSNIDLMLARNRLMQAGIRLSNEDFAAIAEVATNFAAATGEEATGAMQRLGNAIRTVSAEGLSEFGIVLDTTKTRTQQQAQALDELRRKAEQMETGADTLGGVIGELSTAFDNFKTDVFAAINANSQMLPAFRELEKAGKDLARTMGFEVREGLSIGTQFGALLAASLQILIERTTQFVRNWRGMVTAMRSFDLDQINTSLRGMVDSFRPAGEQLEAYTEAILDVIEVQNQMRDSQTDLADLGGGGGGTINLMNLSLERLLELQEQAVNNGNMARLLEIQEAIAQKQGDTNDALETGAFLMSQFSQEAQDALTVQENSIVAQQRRTAEMIRESEERERQRRIAAEAFAEEAQRRLDEGAVGAERINLERRLNELRREGLIDQRNVNAALIESLSPQREMISNQEMYNQLVAQSRTKTKQFEKNMEAVGSQTEKLRGLFSQAMNILVSGQENAGKALLELLDIWLKNFAIQEGFEAAKQFVMAIAAAAQQNYAAAAQHGAAGAGHLALAAAAGGASAAIPNPGAGGAGAAGQQRDQDRDAGREEPGVVNINIGGQVMLSQAEVGRTVRRALQAENRRF